MFSEQLLERLALSERKIAYQVQKTDSDFWVCYCHWPEPKRSRFQALWDKRHEGLTDAEAEELYASLADCRIAQLSQEDQEDEEDIQDEIDDDEEQHAHDYENDQTKVEAHHDVGDGIEDDGDEDDDTNLEAHVEDEDEYEYDSVEDECPDGDEQIIRTDWDPTQFALVIAFHKYAAAYPSIILAEFDDLLKQYLVDTLHRLFEKYGWIAGQPDCATIAPLDRWTAADRNRLEKLYGVWS